MSFQVLGLKDLDGFWDVTRDSFALIGGICLVKTARVFAQKTLVVAWRRQVTRQMHGAYFVNLRFYRLNNLGENKTDFFSQTNDTP